MPRPKSPFKRVRREFDRGDLKRICEMHETAFEDAYSMTKTLTPPSRFRGLNVDHEPFYLQLDRGSDILAVAHLDTCVSHRQRTTGFLDTAAGPVVHSGALDDRLGAYTILELLPRLGINVDVLLTTDEEQGDSTAQFFDSEKPYKWMIEFDRGGTDVVMYQYEDHETERLVKDCGANVGLGSYSDIAYLEHLEIKGFNWGVGYHDYHSVRGYAYLEDYWAMVAKFVKFHDSNADVYLPHEEEWPRRGGSLSSLFDDPTEDPDHWARQWARAQGVDRFNDWDDEPTEEELAEVEDKAWDEVVSEDFDMVNRMLKAGDGWRP